nr:hypothetical protein [Tanacetum cinerariifolium]
MQALGLTLKGVVDQCVEAYAYTVEWLPTYLTLMRFIVQELTVSCTTRKVWAFGFKRRYWYEDGMSGSSVDSGFPSLSQVFGTTHGGLIEGNTVIVGSAGQVAKVNVVSNDAPNATSDLGNDSIPIEVGHESAMKKTHTSYANKLSPMSLTNANLCKLDASCQMMLIMMFGYLWLRFMRDDQWMIRGPWMIRGVPIFLNKWSPSVSLLKEDLSRVPVRVKFHDVPLVAYTSDGNNLIIAVPKPKGPGYTKETIRVEYEWEPPRCSMCLLFAHSVDDYPKAHKRVVNWVENGKGESFEANDEGFIEVKKKKSGVKGVTKNFKPVSMKTNLNIAQSNSFEALNDDDPVTVKVESGTKAFTYDDKPIEKVEYLGDHCSKDEVKPDDNEMISFPPSKPSRVGYGQDILDNIHTICNNLDIKELASSLKGYPILILSARVVSIGAFIESLRWEGIRFRVKEIPKKDKIGSKPDKNGKRGEAGKSQKQLQ